MTAFSLLVSIVPHNSGEFITKAAAAAGAAGGTILMGRGTASSTLMTVFGLGDAAKDLVYIIVPSDIKQTVAAAVKAAAAGKKKHFGILFSIDISAFLRGGSLVQGDCMGTEKAEQLITVIVNKGYADEVMAAARKAGAGGGTVLNARGTAREDDQRFFGIQIVPEKEMVMILASKEKAEGIVSAIQSLRCLSVPGCGIAFCIDVDNFTPLGKTDAQ